MRKLLVQAKTPKPKAIIGQSTTTSTGPAQTANEADFNLDTHPVSLEAAAKALNVSRAHPGTRTTFYLPLS